MSLKAVHLVFVLCATLLAAGFGVWAVERPGGGGAYLALGVISFAVAAGLVIYGVWFLKKLKGVSYL
jgi:hypothetical protein